MLGETKHVYNSDQTFLLANQITVLGGWFNKLISIINIITSQILEHN